MVYCVCLCLCACVCQTKTPTGELLLGLFVQVGHGYASGERGVVRVAGGH